MFIKIVSLLLCGVAVGFLVRKRVRLRLGGVINVLIWVLLFALGVDVGSDERILRGMHTIGLQAIVICLASMLGSCAFAALLWHIVRRRPAAHKEKGGAA